MAFPVVAAVADTDDATGDATVAVNLPAGAGLLIAWLRNGTNRTHTWPLGWIELWDQAGANAGMSGAYLFTDGSHGASANVTLSGQASAVGQCIRITGAHPTQAPEVGTPPAVATATTANPPSVAPPWGAADNLFIAIGSTRDETATVSGYPASYGSNQNANPNGAGTSLVAFATRNSNAASDDPGSFTFSVSDVVQTQTIVVRPAVSLPPPPSLGSFQHMLVR